MSKKDIEIKPATTRSKVVGWLIVIIGGPYVVYWTFKIPTTFFEWMFGA